jgi:hypothetical protein
LKRRAVSWKTPAPFGMLTETLQTQASLALRQIEINGLQLDLQLPKVERKTLRQRAKA